MAVREQREVYSHATIDCSDMTLTEYDVNGARKTAMICSIVQIVGIVLLIIFSVVFPVLMMALLGGADY